MTTTTTVTINGRPSACRKQHKTKSDCKLVALHLILVKWCCTSSSSNKKVEYQKVAGRVSGTSTIAHGAHGTLVAVVAALAVTAVTYGQTCLSHFPRNLIASFGMSLEYDKSSVQ